MFVRWKRRAKSRRKRLTGETALSAYLVSSERVEGKPRQRVVAYLGSIRENATHYVGHQMGFWEAAAPTLDRLELDPETRSAVEASLTRKVPKPTEEGRSEEAARFREAESIIARRR